MSQARSPSRLLLQGFGLPLGLAGSLLELVDMGDQRPRHGRSGSDLHTSYQLHLDGA